MPNVRYGRAVYECTPPDTALDALIKNGVEVPYSCRKGTCLTCMMRAVSGEVPKESQEALRETLRIEGHFLPCVCTPTSDLTVESPDDAAIYNRATVSRIERTTSQICRVFLDPATPLFYHPGQFINLRRKDGLARSYSLASVPRLDRVLELHVKRLSGGAMTTWIFDELRVGEHVDFQGPNGTCFYVPGRPEQAMLLIGNGSGLAPLVGIVRDALHDGHTGPVYLYHGTRRPQGIYLRDVLEGLAEQHENFTYVPCVSGETTVPGCHPGRADDAAFQDHPDLKRWRVFLCGFPPMVAGGKKTAYLQGADLADILADPFDLKELRQRPRAT